LVLVALELQQPMGQLVGKVVIRYLAQLRQQVAVVAHQALLWLVVTAVQAVAVRSAAVRLAEMERLGKAIMAVQRQ
jgi:hypothetical protein